MVRQERIIVIEESEELTVITTTGFHIARRMGEAVSRAYKGGMSFTCGDGEKTIRVLWKR